MPGRQLNRVIDIADCRCDSPLASPDVTFRLSCSGFTTQQTHRVIQQPPHYPPPPRPGGKLSQQRIALIVGGGVLAFVLLCCGGLAVLGVFAPNSPKQDQRNVGDQQAASAPRTTDQTADSAATTQPAAAPTTSAAAPASPTVEKRQVTETKEIPFQTKTVNDSTLPKGTQKIKTNGVPGVKTLTYEVTYTNGAETGRKLISETVTKQPVTQVVAIGTKQASNCDPNYSGACVPIASDVDCAGGSGNGPAYVKGPVTVVGTDIYDLDSDNDGIGCE